MNKYHFHIIGDDLTVETETVDPMTHKEFAVAIEPDYKVSRYTARTATRPELRSAPVIEGFAGPMYDGERFGHSLIRYESWAAYERFSA